MMAHKMTMNGGKQKINFHVRSALAKNMLRSLQKNIVKIEQLW